MARRSGQITARGERKWLVRWYVGTHGGKRRYASKTVHGTKRDAQKFLNSVLRSRDLGQYVEPNRVSLDEYLDRWLRSKHSVASRTREDYAQILRVHVRPVLGSRRLDSLHPADVQELIDKLSERAQEAAKRRRKAQGKRTPQPSEGRRLSPRTHQLVHRVLSGALEQAVSWRLLAVNPAKGINLPKRRKREMRALSAEEIKAFRTAVQGTRHATLFDFVLATGCRPGEALGLRWADLEGDSVTFRQALTRERGKPVLGPVKTPGSLRSVPLPSPVIQALSSHRARQAKRALKIGSVYARDLDLVFANEVGRPLDLANLRERHYKAICEAAEIEGVRGLYDLRHTMATQLLALGANVKVVSERLGHASAAMTLDVYAHVVPGLQEEATEKLGAAFFGGN